GETLSKAEALKALPKTPLTGDDSDAKAHVYGDVGVVTSHRGNVYGLRIWAKTGGNWRMLDYHEVTLAPPATSAAPEVLPCENPCKMFPYKPKNADEAAMIASWQALERAVSSGDGATWALHAHDDFVVASNVRLQI